MRSLKLFAIILLTGVALTGCQTESDSSAVAKGELVLLPKTTTTETTRALGTSFFANGDSINLAITDRSGTKSYIYSYNNGAFTGVNVANTYRFYMDDQIITTLKTSWPLNPPATFVSDQRKDAAFKACDYMTAELVNIEPTSTYVPISFVRQNAKIVFVVTGQNAVNQVIQSLVVNVNEIGFWAHPDPATGNAELIIPPGPVSINAGNIAGRITVAGYTGSVIFDITQTYTLKANTSYIVTLSPSGDNMYASISIGGWYQNENGIGVPLIQQNGYYMIGNQAQLSAIRKLIADYQPDLGNVNWPSAKYMLSNNISMDASSPAWVPLTNFSGEFNYNSFKITPSILFATGGTIVNPTSN